jgi:hypothetical protein
MFYDDELNVDRGLTDLMHRLAAAQQAVGAEWRLRGLSRPSCSPTNRRERCTRPGSAGSWSASNPDRRGFWKT